MAFDKLEFTKNWESAEDFPTYESDENQVRKDMQCLHDEVKNYINDTLLPAAAEKANVINKDDTEVFTPTEDAHPASKKYVDDVARDLTAGAIPDYSIAPEKMTDAVWDHRIESENPRVRLHNTESVSTAVLRQQAHQTFLYNFPCDDENSADGYRALVLNNDASATPELAKALRLVDKDAEGNVSYYNVAHTANLPELGIARIATGSYVGTGTYGSGNPCTLTFGFAPKFVAIYAAAMKTTTTSNDEKAREHIIQAMYGAASSQRYGPCSSSSGGSWITDYFIWGDTSFSWYSYLKGSDMDGTLQLNAEGTTYYYLAIG